MLYKSDVANTLPLSGLENLGKGRGNVRVVLDEALAKLQKPRKARVSLAHLGVDQKVIDSIFSDCFSIPNAEATKPQKSVRGTAKRHFDLLAKYFSARGLGTM